MTLSICINEESVQLWPQRALYRSKNRSLYVADTHWGKVATLRAHHIPLPEGSLQRDLARLSEVLAVTQAKRLVVLGDLVHARQSYAEVVVEEVARWRAQHAELAFDLVPGNHDRHAGALPDSWRIRMLEELHDDSGLMLAHKPLRADGAFVLCGHLHPAWRLRGQGRQAITLPCFLQTEHFLVLPAFAQFTGAMTQALPQPSAVYCVTEERVFSLQ